MSENNLVEFISRERDLKRFAFQTHVTSEETQDTHDTLLVTEAFDAVDWESETVRHDFVGDSSIALRNLDSAISEF